VHQNFRQPKSRGDLWHQVFGHGSVGRYAVLGLSGLAVDVALYIPLVLVGFAPVIATVVSSLSGVVTNYVANAVWNFRVPLRGTSGLKFFLIGVVGLGLSAAIVQFGVMWGAGAWGSKAVSLLIVVPGQYLGHKYWTFRDQTMDLSQNGPH